MGNVLLRVKFIAYVEILSLINIIAVLLHIEKYPFVLFPLTFPVVILGQLLLRLSPLARRLNLFFAPLIVFVYVSCFMIMLDYFISVLKLNLQLNQTLFCILFILFLIIHFAILLSHKVRAQFCVLENKPFKS